MSALAGAFDGQTTATTGQLLLLHFLGQLVPSSKKHCELLVQNETKTGTERTRFGEKMKENLREQQQHNNFSGGGADPTPNSLELALARRVVSLVPPFAPTTSSNQQCLRDSRYFLQQLDQLALWALKMHDSSAKIPPGLLNGNVNQYGDMDQCLDVRAAYHGGVVKGRYCLATMQLQLTDLEQPLLKPIYQLLMSYEMFRCELNDPGHRSPRISLIHWALCVPASCEAHDVHVALADTLQRYTNGTGISFGVRVISEMCQTRDDRLQLPISTYLIGGLFIMLAVFVAIATACDSEWKSRKQELSSWRKAVQAFSLSKNASTLLSISRSADDIESIHGIRAIFVVLILVLHKAMFLSFNPYLNRTTMVEKVAAYPWTTVIRGGTIYTDAFLTISGLLSSYSFYEKLQQSKKLNIPREYMSRLIRLVPNFASLMLFCAFIWPWIGTGPLWNQIVTHNSDLCKLYWWRNLLFIQNYFGIEDMCVADSHHLATEVQLFLLSPFFVYLVWRWRRMGLGVLAAVAAMSATLCYNVTYSNHLNMFFSFGSSVQAIYKFVNLSYMQPSHRASVYLVGIVMGVTLRHCGRDIKMKKMYLFLGWSAAALGLYEAMITPSHMAYSDYVYNPADAARFAAISPIGLCLCLSWMIFVSYIGQGGLLGRILSWRGFLVTTRISYAVYLVQFPIFLYHIGINRVTHNFSILTMLDVPELAMIIVGSTLLTLLVDLPFQNLRNIVFKKPQ